MYLSLHVNLPTINSMFNCTAGNVVFCNKVESDKFPIHPRFFSDQMKNQQQRKTCFDEELMTKENWLALGNGMKIFDKKDVLISLLIFSHLLFF